MDRPLRVLHLEDSPRDAEIIRHGLEAGGMSCRIVVVRGKAGFESALAAEPFDVILSDYNLPDYDGATALKRAQAAQPDVPVILISGTVVEEQAVHCLHIGATDYLLKQHLERLVPAVERAVLEAETRRTRKAAEAALARSEARKAAILESVLDSIITMDDHGVVVEFNAAAERTFGYTKAQAIGRSLADLIIPARFRRAHVDGLAHYLATGEGPLIGKMIEITATRADGSEIPVDLAMTAIHSEEAPVFTAVLRDISARRRADEALVRLAAIVDSSDDAIFSMGMDGTILTWNPGAARLYGYSSNEVIGRSRDLLRPTGMPPDALGMIDRAARGESCEPIETQRMRKDGVVIDISLAISPMRDATGCVTSMSTIARDITSLTRAEAERRLAAADVRLERDRAQRYLDTAGVILLALDLDGRITLINRTGCDLLGWTEEELIGCDFLQTCLPADSRAALREKFQTVADGDVAVVEAPILTKSGGRRVIEWRNTLVRDDAGHVIGTFSSGADISQRTDAIAALRTAEERMRFALEAAGVGIWDMNFETGVLTFSEILEAQYGLKPRTFDGTFDGFMALVHTDDRAGLLAAMEAANQSGADFTVQHRAVWADGTIRLLSGAGRTLLGAHGEPVRAVGISMDVTERRALEAQYQQAQKMEAIGQLAGGVAHDFNNLLTVILGNCELLLDEHDPDAQRQSDVAEIQKAGVSAAALTRQLLAFSRKEIIEPVLLDLNVVVGDMRAMLRRLIREDVEVVLALRTELAPIKADRGQVEQIVLNLAVNARDAMPNGGTLTITVGNVELDAQYGKTHLAVRPGPYVALTVRDTGSGITPGVLARLFEPFFTTKEIGRGTGLGLATVHGIVSRSGGSVDVSSDVGKGTAFKVYFPRADADEMMGDAPTVLPNVRAGGETVLVVEDAEGLRLLTTRLLQRHGYTVLVAANADEAARVFDANPVIDVILTDVVMPGGSGPEVAKRLAEKRPGLKVIYMSGYTDEAIVHHGVLEPGIAFLHKPFTSDAIGRKIRDVLDR